MRTARTIVADLVALRRPSSKTSESAGKPPRSLHLIETCHHWGRHFRGSERINYNCVHVLIVYYSIVGSGHALFSEDCGFWRKRFPCFLAGEKIRQRYFAECSLRTALRSGKKRFSATLVPKRHSLLEHRIGASRAQSFKNHSTLREGFWICQGAPSVWAGLKVSN